jgi:Periplasmic component of the Tol biopolymer transport system
MASVGSWKLGPKAGSQTLQAFYNVAVPFGRAATGDTAVFTAVAKAGPLASVVAVDGVDQFGHTGGTLLTPLRVMALDSFGNPVPGVHVSFSVVTGSGRIDGADASTGSDGEAASGIWTLGPEAGPQDVRADAGTAQVMFRATACEPNACRLLFIRSRNIFTWDAGTSRQLTAGNCSNFARASRDGNRIAFVRDDCDGEIILTDADGSNVTRLTAAAVNGGLAWSPDGRALALGNHGFIDILNLNQNDGTPTRLVDGHDPDWSPDGKRILFVTANSAIRTVNADGSDTVEILPSENRYDEVSFDSPKWSPDGKRIAFTRCDEITCDIYVMQADGSELKRLTRDRGFAGISSYSPSWSPDGKRIAFTRSGDPTSTYYVNDTGGEPTLLINSAYYAEWLR